MTSGTHQELMGLGPDDFDRVIAVNAQLLVRLEPAPAGEAVDLGVGAVEARDCAARR